MGSLGSLEKKGKTKTKYRIPRRKDERKINWENREKKKY